MKLNGKLYLKESSVLDILEDIVIILEQGEWHKIHKEFGNHVKQEHAEDVAKQLADFQDMFRVYFRQESYRKIEDIISISEENMYDVVKEKVSLYTQGAYGVIISSDDSSIKKFVFNKSINYFISKLEKSMEIRQGKFLSNLLVIFLEKDDEQYEQLKPAFEKHGWAFKHDKNIFFDVTTLKKKNK